MKKRIPFSMLPQKLTKKLAKRFYGVSKTLSKFFPEIGLNLTQSGLPFENEEYLAITVLNTIFNFFLFFTLLFFILIIAKVFTLINLMLVILGALGLCAFTSFMSIAYPKTIALKRKKQLEKDLLFALRELLIRSRSGIPLYDSMVGISNSNYGLVSEEFKRTVKEIESGRAISDALEDMVLRNPSEYFRGAIWQIINSMKAGTDVSRTLKASVETLSKEQMVEIKSYGAELNPLALVYMMLSVVIPTLGITFLIILSSFLKINITKEIFYAILGFLALFQFFFIGIIKTRRPSLIK